jgi:D-ribose pyranase
MGHTDRLIVCDAGFPVPPTVPRIDLAITRNLPPLPGVPHDLMPHVEFKQSARDVRGVIRTGDFVPYSNVTLVAGVVFP